MRYSLPASITLLCLFAAPRATLSNSIKVSFTALGPLNLDTFALLPKAFSTWSPVKSNGKMILFHWFSLNALCITKVLAVVASTCFSMYSRSERSSSKTIRFTPEYWILKSSKATMSPDWTLFPVTSTPNVMVVLKFLSFLSPST